MTASDGAAATHGYRNRDVRLALLDMDGTLCTGSRPIPGAPAFLQRLRARGIQPVFFTNNATRTPEEVCNLLQSCGMAAEPWEVCTAAQAAADLLAQRYGAGSGVALVGMNGLRVALMEAGLRPIGRRDDEGDTAPHVARASANVAAAVLGLDKGVTYAELTWFCRHVARLGAYVLTNADKRLPAEDGFLPGNGALGSFVTTATGVEPTVAGKPSVSFVAYALHRYGVQAAEAILVGDNPLTDIAGGLAAGVYTIRVRTGVAATESIAEGSALALRRADADHTEVDAPPEAREVVDSVADLFPG